jgi:hypothetical protein
MNKTVSLFIVLTLLAAFPAWGQDADVQAQQPKAKNAGEAIYLYARANYFRLLVKHRNCESLDEHAFTETNQRFENARLQLVQLYGDNHFPADMPAGGPLRDGRCDELTLDAYSRHVTEIEQLLQTQN